MKRSKIFLGVTTALLAVAGVTAAKFTQNTLQAYYITFNKTWCECQRVNCTQSGVLDCKFITMFGNAVQVYTLGPCGTYNPQAPTNCIHKVKYNGIH